MVLIATTAASTTQADQDEDDVLQPGQFPPLNTRAYLAGVWIKVHRRSRAWSFTARFLRRISRSSWFLSLGDLMQKERKKVFVMLGTVFSAVVLVLTVIDIKHRSSTLAVRFKHKIITD